MKRLTEALLVVLASPILAAGFLVALTIAAFQAGMQFFEDLADWIG